MHELPPTTFVIEPAMDADALGCAQVQQRVIPEVYVHHDPAYGMLDGEPYVMTAADLENHVTAPDWIVGKVAYYENLAREAAAGVAGTTFYVARENLVHQTRQDAAAPAVGRIIGFALGQVVNDQLWFNGMYLDKEYRGNGIGLGLTGLVLGDLFRERHDNLHLVVVPHLRKAVRFHELCGFMLTDSTHWTPITNHPHGLPQVEMQMPKEQIGENLAKLHDEQRKPQFSQVTIIPRRAAVASEVNNVDNSRMAA